MRTLRAVAALIALSVCVLPTFAQQKQLTVDDIFDPQKRVNFSGSIPQLSWLPDGKSFLKTGRGTGLERVDALSGKAEPFLDQTRIERAFAAIPGMSAQTAKEIADDQGFLFNAEYSGALVDFGNDLYYIDFSAYRAVRLTSTPGEELDASFSPDGKLVGFVRDDNLYVVDLATQHERALTSDGSSTRHNGHLVWVYEEEIYGRGNTTGYWWSPDSSALAYLSLDDGGTSDFLLVDEIPTDQHVEYTRYPQVGDPNPSARLGVVSALGGSTSWVDLAKYPDPDRLLVRVGWTPDSKQVVYEVQNRVQNWLDVNTYDVSTSGQRTIVHEESTFWVDVVDVPKWLADGSFIWQSDRSGFRHLYHYGADGKLLGQSTKGDWDVRTYYGEKDGWLYFSSAEHSPIADHVYRVKLDGTGLQRLTDIEGDHNASFNDQFSMFVDSSNTATTPTQLRLRKSDGSLVRVIEENKVDALSQYAWGKVEFLQVPTRDGFPMEAMMIKPPNFDPSKKYPVLSYTYSGPGAASVRDGWGRTRYLWHQLIAQHGYIIWICDNRSASAKGVRTAQTAFHNFGDPELRDLEDGVAWLKKQPYVDPGRIGLWGWSYGGFMTAYALTHSTSFKIGISGAPVTDWRLYDSIYTERYMGLPGENADGYRKTSVLEAASNLSGKLLLIHGAIDNNVHPQNSVRFIDQLQKAGKQFQFMLYPQSRHGVTNPLRVKHQYQMMTDFVLNNL